MPASASRTLPVTRRYADPDSKVARLHRQARAVMPGGNSRTSVFMAPCAAMRLMDRAGHGRSVFDMTTWRA